MGGGPNDLGGARDIRRAAARSVDELIRSRFDGVATYAGDPTVLVVDGIDQAGVRAVLTLLWDTGHELRSMGRHPG